MRIKSLIVGVLAAGLLLSSNNHTFANSRFTDVGIDHWAEKEINFIFLSFLAISNKIDKVLSLLPSLINKIS